MTYSCCHPVNEDGMRGSAMTAAHMAVAPRVFEPGPIPAAPSIQSRALAHVLNHSLRRIGDLARLDNRVHLRIVREFFDVVGYLPLARGTRVHAINDDGASGHWVAARNA